RRSSGGLNLGVASLARAVDFDAAATVDGALAGRIIWFDALTSNADRSWRHPNMLSWREQLYLIDHGATLTYQHRWNSSDTAASRPYDISDHALVGCGPLLDAADRELAGKITTAVLHDAVAAVPDDWLEPEPGLGAAEQIRQAHVRQLSGRLANREAWLAGMRETALQPGLPPREPGQPARRGRPGWHGHHADAPMVVAPMSSERYGFEYAVLRVVPRVDRGEMINAGVLLYCQSRHYLTARVALDSRRLLAIDPAADIAGIE